jgi:hypothetical protein
VVFPYVGLYLPLIPSSRRFQDFCSAITPKRLTRWSTDSQVRLNTELLQIVSRSPTVRTVLQPRRQAEDLHNPSFEDRDLTPHEEEFDEIVLCVLADTAKRILQKEARGVESWVLGRTTWSDDVTVTHSVSEPLHGCRYSSPGHRLYQKVVHDRV